MRTRRKQIKISADVDLVRCPFAVDGAVSTFRVIRVHAKQNQDVTAGSLLCSVAKAAPATTPTNYDEEEEEDHTVNVLQLRSQYDGRVSEVLVQDDQTFDAKTQVLMKIEYCVHGVVLPSGLCGSCGRIVNQTHVVEQQNDHHNDDDDDDDDDAKVKMVVNVEGGMKLAVSKHEAEEVSHTQIARLFRAKKLSLVLDLDHTLLHCTDDPRAQSFMRRPHVYAFELDGKQMFLKPRPGLHHFLQIMKQHFEMHVYTAGTRPYALKVCAIIDPHGEFFKDRIVSRDDNPELSADDKRISRLFPVDDSMVCIVDDRREVWHKAGSDRNLVTCQAFYYFLGMHEVNNSSDPVNELRASSSSQEEETKDVGLARVEEVLMALHRDFYTHSGDGDDGEEAALQRQVQGKGGGGKDVKEILRRLHQTKVFNHKRVLVFDPELLPLHRRQHLEDLARESGAELRDEVDATTTHVISDGGTAICLLARHFPGAAIWVVTPHWLERCSHYWKHVREDSFSLFATSQASAAVTAAVEAVPDKKQEEEEEEEE